MEMTKFESMDVDMVARMIKLDVNESMATNFNDNVNVITRYCVGSSGEDLVHSLGFHFNDFINYSLYHEFMYETVDENGEEDTTVKPRYINMEFRYAIKKGVDYCVSQINKIEDGTW